MLALACSISCWLLPPRFERAPTGNRVFSVVQRTFSASDFPQVGQVFFKLFKAFAGGLVFFFLKRLAFNLQLHHLTVHLVQRLGFRVYLGAQVSGGFIYQVDRLIRQLPIGDVAVGKRGGSDDRGVRDAHAVVHFIAGFEPAQNADCVFHGWFQYHNRLEAAFQGGVFFYVFAVLAGGGGANQVQFMRASMV